MVSPFEIVIEKMIELGFYSYVFPFLISSAIFYALFRKSKILGDSVVINAVIALSIAFMVLGFPVLVGFTLESQLSLFFTQATVFILIFVIGIIIASVFYPDLPKLLTEQFTRRTTIYQMIALGIGLFVTSGLVIVFTQGIAPQPDSTTPAASGDLVLIISGIVIFIILIMIAASTLRSES